MITLLCSYILNKLKKRIKSFCESLELVVIGIFEVDCCLTINEERTCIFNEQIDKC